MTDTTTAAETTATTTTTAAAPPWYEGKAAPEDIGHWDNKGWKKDDPAAIAIEATKAARELQKHFGVPADQLLKLPKPEDGDAWKGVYQRLGTPADAKDYDLSGIKFPDGTELEQGFVDLMRGELHKANVTKDAAPEIVKSVVKYLSDADAADVAAATNKLTEEKAALAKSWGTKPELLNDHPNMAYAKIAARRLGIPPDAVAALESVAGYASVMDLMRKIGASTNEDTFVKAPQGDHITTTNGAMARLEELKADKAWSGRLLAGGLTERNEMNNLLALIHGSAA